ncbi:MAG TPA: Hpt domain-containing protein, partial [Gammaproteobacteria bacterium]
PEPAPKPAAPSATGPAVIQSDEVDPEIVEIFLEEAQEVMSALRENFPRWRSNPSDTEALTTVRRSFHTLKGSGRMVGARLIGEFAWSIENMLNRVIDQTVSASDEMFALVEQSIAAFPELIEQLEVGTAPKVDIQPLMDTAAAFSRGEPAPGSAGAAPPVPATAPASPPPRRQVSAEEPTMVSPAGLQVGGTDEPTVIAPRVEVLAPAGSGMDPVLYDIFNREADGHLAVLAEFTRDATAGKTEITEELIRALHTLHGSAAMAGAGGIVALLEPLDRYIGELQAQKQSIPIHDVPLFGEAHDAARALLTALADTAPPPAPNAALLARLHALKALPAAAEAEDIVMSGPAITKESKEAVPARAVPQKDKPLKYVQLSDLKDFDPELAAIFFEEATELLESTDNTMHQWTQRKSDPAMVTQLQRNLHTIKGGARMAGLVPMGDLSHEMETVLTDVVDGRIAVSTELFALLNRSVDRLHRMLEQSYANQPIVDGGDLVIELKRVHGHTVDEELEPEAPEDRYETVRAPAPPPPIIEYGEQQDAAVMHEPAAEADEEAVAAEAALGGEGERRTGSRIQHELVRVRADLLESALNYAGEMGIYRSRLEQQITTINFNLTELDQTVVRLRDQLRKLEIETEAQIRSQFVQEGGDVNPDFDPLELDQYSTLQQLSRALAESVSDLVSIQALLLNQAREAETLLLQQSRVTTELQDGLMRTRMVPFSRHAQRLRRVVRQTADESNKHVDLKFMGAEGEMDRQVL